MKLGCRRGLTFLDLVVVIALLVVLTATSLAVAQAANERDLRLRCALHLRQMAVGLLLYANDNKGAYPRTRYDYRDEKLRFFTGVRASDPFSKEGPEANDVTAAMFLIVRNGDTSPHAFLCPSVQVSRGAAGVKIPPYDRSRKPHEQVFPEAKWDIFKISNFPGPDDVNYGIVSPYPTAVAVGQGYKFNSAVVAEFAVAADAGPGAKAAAAATPAAKWSPELAASNSPNHGGEGQNVLFNDGHVEWFFSPFAGKQMDNIYTSGKDNKGTDPQPAWQLDSVMMPARAATEKKQE